MKPLYIAAGLIALMPVSAWTQDAFGYTATDQTPYSYLNLASTSTAILANSEDGTAAVNLPFVFQFYGVSYNSVCIGVNGLLTFGGCLADSAGNVDLTSSPIPGDYPIIAPLWTDLSFVSQASGTVFYDTLGAAPNRRFVVQWNNAALPATPELVNFEVVLNETTNTVLVQYLNVRTTNSATDGGASATVGIRAPGGDSNGKCTEWSYRAPVLADNSAILYTPPSQALAITTALLNHAVVGTPYQQALSATGGTAPYTWQIASGTLPSGITLDGAAALLGGTAAAAATTPLTISVTDASVPAHTASASLPLVTVGKLGVTTTSLPNGFAGTAYSQSLAAGGGWGSLNWQLTSGTLPGGLTLAADTGLISGTPGAAVASTPLTFTVLDSDTPQQTANVALTLTIAPAVHTCDVEPGGGTDFNDVVHMAKEVFGTLKAVDDLNQDTFVDIVDVQIVVNAARGLTCAAK